MDDRKEGRSLELTARFNLILLSPSIGLFILVWGLIVLAFLQAKPPSTISNAFNGINYDENHIYPTSSSSDIDETAPLSPSIQNQSTPGHNNNNNIPPQEQTRLGFVEVLLIPGVIAYAMSNAFIKLVSYSFLLWLPYYLTTGNLLIHT